MTVRRELPTAPTPLLIFAKPPRAGVAKTRLARDVGAEVAAELAAAFLSDTLAQARALGWARVILATTESGFDTGSPADMDAVWHQGDGDLGARLERMLSRALLEAPTALALGADTPGLPGPLLERARTLLAANDAVLGPADDGGFYLLGLRRCPSGLLSNLPWSSSDTFERTRQQLESRGLHPQQLPNWFDVDRAADARRLLGLIRSGRVIAPASRGVLERWARSGQSPA